MTQISAQQYFKPGKKIPTAGQDEDTSAHGIEDTSANGIAETSAHGNEDTSNEEWTPASERPRLQSCTAAASPQTSSLPSSTSGVTVIFDDASTMSDTEEMEEAESVRDDDRGFFDGDGRQHCRDACDRGDIVRVCSVLAGLLHESREEAGVLSGCTYSYLDVLHRPPQEVRIWCRREIVLGTTVGCQGLVGMFLR